MIQLVGRVMVAPTDCDGSIAWVWWCRRESASAAAGNNTGIGWIGHNHTSREAIGDAKFVRLVSAGGEMVKGHHRGATYINRVRNKCLRKSYSGTNRIN